MIKDKLHTISDEDAIEVAKLLLTSSTSNIFTHSFEKITRIKYDPQEGTDAEEAVNIFFKCVVKEEHYRTAGWKDKDVFISLIEHDRYHDYPYFYASYKEESDKTWKYEFLSNHIEAIEFLQSKQLL
jgi:hypothetical protein